METDGAKEKMKEKTEETHSEAAEKDTSDSNEFHTTTTVEKGRVEGESETTEKKAEEGGDETLPSLRRGKEKVNAEEDEDEEEMGDLPRGYYKVEHIRDKRFIKGVGHYLIKWVGWPESANTWEPIQHLDMCIEVVHAYEESLISRKNKGRLSYDSQASSSKPSKKQATLGAGRRRLQLPDSSNPTSFLGRGGWNNGVRPNGAGAFKPAARCFSKAQSSSSVGAGPCNGIVKIDRIGLCPNHLNGAKRRKSGPVKRFMPQVTPTPDQPVVQQNRTIGPVGAERLLGTGPSRVAAVYHTNQANSDDSTITRIIEIKSFSVYASNGVQEAVVTFTVLRSDGSEATVNNEYLKAKHPVLLANFYEQHLRI